MHNAMFAHVWPATVIPEAVCAKRAIVASKLETCAHKGPATMQVPRPTQQHPINRQPSQGLSARRGSCVAFKECRKVLLPCSGLHVNSLPHAAGGGDILRTGLQRRFIGTCCPLLSGSSCRACPLAARRFCGILISATRSPCMPPRASSTQPGRPSGRRREGAGRDGDRLCMGEGCTGC